MGTIKEMNIKNQAYYFYNDIIDIEMLKLDKKTYKNNDIYNIGYVIVKKKLVLVMIFISVNPLYFKINSGNGYIEKKRFK